jgi:DNA-binding MarR family transcriptional regulator
VLVELTPKARAFGDRVHALKHAQLRAVMDTLEPHERPAFVRGLEALAHVLRLEPSALPGCPAWLVRDG